LAQKTGLMQSAVIFWVFLGEFLGYLDWIGPNRKYFSETEGPTVIFTNAQGLRQNFQEAEGPKCKIQWTGSTTRGLGGAARVHRGPRWHEQNGAAARC
jgi:hypothetical protein